MWRSGVNAGMGLCVPESTPDYYAVLGLDRRCTLEQIRTAYRLLAKRHHPDLNPGSADALTMLQAVNAAYEVLSDPARRKAYDEESASDDAPSAKPAPRGRVLRNIAQDALLRIDDFIKGTRLEVLVNDPGNPAGSERYAFVVPEGTAPGSRFRIPREGAMSGGFVTVRVKVMPGARFKAKGSDVQTELRIQNQRAAKGGSEMVPGPAGGLVRVEIPAGVARGEILRVRGQGLPKAHGGRGDLLVKVTYRPEVRIARR
jgi:curved DNA-binding protein